MVAKDRFLGCPPTKNGTCGCGKLCCGKAKYIQPLRPKSFKPECGYVKPTVPMNVNTIYKNSYIGTAPEDIKMCRVDPCIPVNSLHPSNDKIDQHTITKLSFPEHSQGCKRSPILPHRRNMLGNGPMQDFTTQKHDYVAKPLCKRNAIIHETNLKSNDVPLQSDTVQKLSFVPPDAKSMRMVKSFKPCYEYKRPDVPMDEMTTHKLSFMPVCPQVKEEYPWAKKVAIDVANVPIEKCTTYKLSYIPNCGIKRSKPLRAKDNHGLVTTADGFDNHTVYKQSFFGSPDYCKRTPILPTLQLQKSNAKMNSDSVYLMSYPGHSQVVKSAPILPHSRFLFGSGPLDDLTTQRRDFVDKPHCRRSLILPSSQLEKDDSPLDNQTTMKLSYMQPNGLGRSTPIRPKNGVTKPNDPMDSATIHKLSFVPVATPKKEEYPWMERKTHMNGSPMEFGTTQNLSFMPPGQIIKDENGCYCSYPEECMSSKYPKADSF